MAEEYSDTTNKKLYMNIYDIERLWMDRYLRRHSNLNIEIGLTHLGR
jgi:hypothetical protein